MTTKNGALVAFGMRGNVWRSEDAGKTWAQIPIPNKIGINGGHVLDDGSIVLVGNVGMVATSRDDGKSFTVAMSPRGAGLSTVVQSAKGDLIVVGEAGASKLDPKLIGK